jgi:hypothetical protein
MNIEKYDFSIPQDLKVSRRINKKFREVKNKIRTKEIILDLYDDSEISNYLNVYNQNTISHYVSFFQFLLNNKYISKKSKILDFGCWFGFSSLVLSQISDGEVTSVDIISKDKVMSLINCFDHDFVNYIALNDFIGNNINKIKFKSIILYDVIDEYVKINNNLCLIEDFNNLLKYLISQLEINGNIIISDFESTSKIKLDDLINLSKEYFNNIKIYYNNDNLRFLLIIHK